MAHYEQRYQPGGNNLLPPVILNLLIANGLLFLLQMLFKPARGLGTLEIWLALWPLGDYQGAGFFSRGSCSRMAFLHSTSTFTHLFFNMLALWMFGRDLENEWGEAVGSPSTILAASSARGLIQLVVTSASVAAGGWAVPTLGGERRHFRYSTCLCLALPGPADHAPYSAHSDVRRGISSSFSELSNSSSGPAVWTPEWRILPTSAGCSSALSSFSIGAVACHQTEVSHALVVVGSRRPAPSAQRLCLQKRARHLNEAGLFGFTKFA